MIKAYWTRILLFAIAGAFVALVASMLIPKKYEAEAELEVDQSAQAQPMINTAQDVSTADLRDFSRPRNISTQVEQLQSLGVLTIAARSVAAKNGEGDPTADPTSELNPVSLQHELNVIADPNSDIIDYRIRMSNADLAQQVCQAIYDAFVKQNQENARDSAERAIVSLQAQANVINGQLKAIDQKSGALRKKTHSPDVNSEVTSAVTALDAIKQTRDNAEMEAAGDERSVAVLTSALASTPKFVPQSTTTQVNPVYQKLQSDLASAESDRAALAAQYLPGNEMLRAADEKITTIKSQLDKLKADEPYASSSGLNPNYLTLETQLATAKATSDAAQKRLVVANQAVADREREVGDLPDIQTQLAGLDRQQLTLTKVWAGYQDDLKTLEAAKAGRMSPTEEITPATSFPQPVSPKPAVNALFGALIGLLLGIVSMQYTEAKRQPIRSLVQLNGLAASPVYRVIPELREPFRGLKSAPPESFESLLVNYLRDDKLPYRIAVVGLNKDSGASITALNVAISASRHGSKVLFVQCDAKGALARIGQKDIQPGTEVEIAPMVKAITATSALGVNEQHAGLAWSLTSREQDLTVIDLEPANRSAEYAFVAPYVDEVILLVRAGRARSVEFLQAQQALRDAGCRRVTVVFTRSSDFSVVVDAIESQMESGEVPAVPAWLLPARAASSSGAEASPAKGAELPASVHDPSPKGEELVAMEEPAAETFHPEPGDEEPSRTATHHLTVEEPLSVSANVIEVPHEKLNRAEAEGPVRRHRSTPTVHIEDFGGISRAKAPEKEETSSPAEPAPSSRSRRANIDTSEIDS